MSEQDIQHPTKPCTYCGRSVTCNPAMDCKIGHNCRYEKHSDCRGRIAMIRSNIPCYKHLEYYSKHKEWNTWFQWDSYHDATDAGERHD